MTISMSARSGALVSMLVVPRRIRGCDDGTKAAREPSWVVAIGGWSSGRRPTVLSRELHVILDQCHSLRRASSSPTCPTTWRTPGITSTRRDSTPFIRTPSVVGSTARALFSAEDDSLGHPVAAHTDRSQPAVLPVWIRLWHWVSAPRYHVVERGDRPSNMGTGRGLRAVRLGEAVRAVTTGPFPDASIVPHAEGRPSGRTRDSHRSAALHLRRGIVRHRPRDCVVRIPHRQGRRTLSLRFPGSSASLSSGRRPRWSLFLPSSRLRLDGGRD